VKILLTGGAGFIGSHLADRLLAGGHSVVCVDDLSLGRKSNIAHNLANKRFAFVKTDVSDLKKLSAVFKKHKFDCVFHLAANSDIQAGGKCPDIDLSRTFMTTYTVLEAMRLHGVKKLVFASTSAVYGEAEKPLREDMRTRPVSLYGAGKLSSEAWISAFCENFDMQAWVLRFPNVVGSRATHGVIFDFLRKLKKDPSRLPVLGNGKQKKPYLHVSDLVDGILFVFNHAKERYNCYNIAGRGATTVSDIAKLCVAAAGLKNVRLEYTGSDRGWKGDVPRFSYDLSAITKLGWKSSMDSTKVVERAAKEIASEI
jgi:UDP-glucose 4-epimerase